MPANITDVDAFTDPVQAPADGDPANGATFQLSPQALANRTRNLKNRLDALEAGDIADILAALTALQVIRETNRTYKIVNGTYAAGATLDLSVSSGNTHGFTESPAGELLMVAGAWYLVLLNVWTPDGTFAVALQRGGVTLGVCKGPTITGAADVSSSISRITSCIVPADEKLRLVNALGGDLVINDGGSDVVSTLTIQRLS